MTGHDNLPKYDRLWVDYVENESRIMAKSEETHEENQALAACWKGKKNRSFPQSNQGEISNNINEGRSNNRYDRGSNDRFERKLDKRRQDRRPDPKSSRIQCLSCEGYWSHEE